MTNLNIITRLVQPATTQIGIIRGNYFCPLGSGVFIEYKQSFYLITAGHLLSLANYSDLLIPLPGSQEGLFIVHFGDLLTTYQNTEDETEVDYAIIRFRAKHLEEKIRTYYSYIPEANLLFNHQLLLERANYFAFGYPISKSKFNYKTRNDIDNIPLRITTTPYENTELLIDQGYNLDLIGALNIRKKIFVNRKLLTLPKTTGMSGCGIYFIPHLNCNHTSSEFYLIGVLIEIDLNLRFLIFTKINIILGELEKID